MGAREAPTVRQRRLGAELRKLREQAGLTATQAGAHLSMGQSRVSNIEAGRIGVSPDRVRAMARGYGCGNSQLVGALADMATDGRRHHWWDRYREALPAPLLDLAELEHHAAAIRSAQVALLPGLLQTADYVRQLIRTNRPDLSPPDAEERVSFRIKRQQIFYKDQPTPFLAIIHEAALRMQFGGRRVSRAQLRHLQEMGERDNITVLAIPFSAEAFPGAGQTVVYAEGPVPELDTVQLDTEHGCVFLHADAQLEKYRLFMKQFEDAALTPEATRDLVQKIIDTL